MEKHKPAATRPIQSPGEGDDPESTETLREPTQTKFMGAFVAPMTSSG